MRKTSRRVIIPTVIIFLVLVHIAFSANYFYTISSSGTIDYSTSTQTPTIVWTDGFENDPLGRQFTWGDDSFLYGGYAADISAGSELPPPSSFFEVTSDCTEGSHGLKGTVYGGSPVTGSLRAHRFCLLISPANSYASGITGAIY